MRIDKTLLLALTIALFLNNGSIALSQESEEENVSTPATTIEPDALPTSNKRSYDEGVTIKDIELSGNLLVPEETILNSMKTKKGSTFNRQNIQDDLKSIYDLGYFTDKIKVVPQATTTGVKLRIEVEENIPVTGINVSGNTVISTAEIEDLFKDQTGLPQNISQLNSAISKIEKIYGDKGYALARVKKIADDPDGMINIEINEGVINKVKITGNTKTKEYVIKRNMLTAENTIYNEDVLKDDLKRIFGSKSFEDVRRVVSASTDDPDKYDVTVEVDEKRTGSISLGGGVDTGSGLFGSLGYQNSNFLGRGQVISAVAMLGTGVIQSNDSTIKKVSVQFEGTYTEPRIGNTLNSVSATVFGRDYASYQVPLAIEKRIGGTVEWARPIKRFRNLAGSLGLEVEKVRIKEGDLFGWLSYYGYAYPQNTILDALQDRAQQLEGGTFMTLAPSLSYDTRNSVLSPTRGWYNTIRIKESFGLGADVGQYGRVFGNIRRYFPIGEKTTFALNFQGGSQMIGSIPEFSMFRLGGTNTIRGFREGYIGSGSQYLMGSAELRTPIPLLDKIKKIPFVDNIRGAIFFDAGRLFSPSLTNKLFQRPEYGMSTGLGLRVNIPGMGPIRVDYGIPLTKIGNFGSKGGRFTFGFGEKF